MHPRYLAILALVLIGAGGLLGILFGLQQSSTIRFDERNIAENRPKALEMQRLGRLEDARQAEEDAARDTRYLARGRQRQLLAISIGGGIAGLSLLGIVLLLVFPGAGRTTVG